MMTKKKPISIYIHIPFCRQKCLYCDFLSAAASPQVRENYVRALIRELKIESERFIPYRVKTVFIGGGTPTILSAGQIKRILDTLFNFYEVAPNAEITVECNPGTVTKEKLKKLYECGINRLSIGLQSARDEELKRLGRIHTYRQFKNTYSWARKAGFTNINIDLMSALPGQSFEDYCDTLFKVLKLQPEHLSAYSLIIEPGTPFYEWYGETAGTTKTEKTPGTAKTAGTEKTAETTEICTKNRILPLPDEDTERMMYHETKRILHEYGYERYEISNYAKKGFECRHNQVYWTGSDYAGFGTGAASYVSGIRYSRIKSTGLYIEKMKGGGRTGNKKINLSDITCDFNQLTKKDRMEEFMFLGLRQKCGVSKKAFYNQFGLQLEEVYKDVLLDMHKKHLLSLRGNTISLTQKGMDLSNYVMSAFLL